MPKVQSTDIVKTEVNTLGLPQQAYDIIGKKTDPKHIYTRPGRGNMKLEYVTTSHVVEMLNQAFKGAWDFKVIDRIIEEKQIAILGELTVKIPVFDKEGTMTRIETLTKSQWGSGERKGFDLGDDLKGATSDALKKCASLFGIAQDVYSKGEYGTIAAQQAEGGETETGTVVTTQSPTPATTPPQTNVTPPQLASEAQLKYIHTLCYVKGKDIEKVKAFYKITSTKELTKEQAHTVIEKLQTYHDVKPIGTGKATQADSNALTPDEEQQLLNSIPEF